MKEWRVAQNNEKQVRKKYRLICSVLLAMACSIVFLDTDVN